MGTPATALSGQASLALAVPPLGLRLPPVAVPRPAAGVDDRVRRSGQHPMTGPARMVIRLQEPDYCYGVGELTLRVIRIQATAAQLDTLEWVNVRGVEIWPNGQDGPELLVLVRVSALRGQPVGFALRPARAPVRDGTTAATAGERTRGR